MKLIVMFVLLLVGSLAYGNDKVSPRLARELQRVGSNEPVYAWVYLNDKGEFETLRFSVPTNVVSERSLRRRSKVRPQNALVDYSDLPVSQLYVEQIAENVLALRNRSKWFNSVSVLATKQQLLDLTHLSFVREIDVMARFRKNQSEEELQASQTSNPQPLQPAGTHTLDYGASFGQVNQINVPAVHDLGYNGGGVFVGVFDNGFRLPTHEAFATMTIHATYDFVDHKVSVVPNNPSTSFGSHGVNTLSTIGGFKSGQLIGPAYGATFLLARTENDSSETPIEEDNWVAAIEWADSIGVDVTSTSLGYLTYDLPYSSWTWQDMNGNTTVITRAADAAVGRGILVVNSAGNNGFNASHNTLNAPADGDSVLAVGAVDAAGTRSSFSSVGPTTSIPPRIKPDVMAQGSSVYVASSTLTTGYTSVNGTSFSCPLTAGAAALIVQAQPNATPLEIMDAMRTTASNAASPNNQYGWGIVNTLAAINSPLLPIQLRYFTATAMSGVVEVRWGTLSEINNYGFYVERRRAGSSQWLMLENSFVPGHGTTNEPQHYLFTDRSVGAGNWQYRLRQIDLDGTIHFTEPVSVSVVTSVPERLPVEFTLMQNYPNPFNPNTTIRFSIPASGLVSLKVFDVVGREVATLLDNQSELGSYAITFDASALAGGIYYYRLRSAGMTNTKAMILAK
jgi:subtilisin family serine protease